MVFCTVLLLGITSSCEKGDMGPEGPRGIQGERGAAGANGDKGAKGDRGAAGSRGATGSQGPKGERGATGPAGPQGAPGTANVVSSGWIDYQINSSPNTSTVKTMEYIFPANVLSLIGAADIAEFLSEGGLLVLYGKNYGNTQHKMLPYNHSHVDYTWMSTGLGGANSILIRIASTDGSTLTDYDYAGFRGNEFRYVLIPVGVQVSGAGRATDIDWSRISYAEAKQMLGLKD